MPSKFAIRLLLPAVAALAGGLTFGLHRAWDDGLRPQPVFVCPQTIDLGSRERGDTAVARFTIRNTGSRELVVDQFSTSCSCAGVEREVDGKPVRVESVHVPPRATAELFVRMTVGAPIGGSQWVQVFCRTNDPARPIGQLDISVPLVTGGIYPSPSAVVFGSVPVGTPGLRIVELYDADSLGRRVARARSLQPERFAVRVLPPAPGDGAAGSIDGRTLIARLEVTARTEQPGPLDGEVEVEVTGEGSRPCRLPVTGEVTSEVQCLPRAIVLPRRVGGQVVFSNELLVRSRTEVPLEVRVVATPAWLRVDVRPVAGRPDQWLVCADGKPDAAAPAGAAIRLWAQAGGRGEEVVVPVTVAELPR